MVIRLLAMCGMRTLLTKLHMSSVRASGAVAPLWFTRFFDAIVSQNRSELETCFEPDAKITWANTNEEFTVSEYVQATCEYPGKWQGDI